MLVNGLEFCDVCCAAIPVGEPYATSIIPRERAIMFLTLIERMGEDEELPEDLGGNVKLAICLTCKMNLSLTSEFVN